MGYPKTWSSIPVQVHKKMEFRRLALPTTYEWENWSGVSGSAWSWLLVRHP
jgi:hypothetical protein